MDELLSRQIARLNSEITLLEEKTHGNRPNTYRPKLAKRLYELGMLYKYECNDPERAEVFLARSADQYDQYTGRIKQATSDKIETLRQLVALYRMTDRTDMIENTLFRLLKVYEPLAEKYWWIYSENVAIIQWELGNLYASMNRSDAAEQMYRKSLATHAEFDDEDKGRYCPGTAQCYRSLGRLLEAQGRFSEAKKCYRTAIDMLKELGETDPSERGRFAASLKMSRALLADLNRKLRDMKKGSPNPNPGKD